MSNSPLVDYIARSPNHSGRRTQAISKIAIHHTAGVLSVETIGRIFSGSDRQASSNYGIGYDGRVGMYVDEGNRSWCTSNAWVDQQAVTIETSNSAVGGDWPVSNHVLAKLVDLCVDICKRNGIGRVVLTNDKDGTLVMHKWFAATACPGPFLASKFAWIAAAINERLQAVFAPAIKEIPVVYTVVPGDYLSKIGSKFELDWRNIAALNGIFSPYNIFPGQIIKLLGTKVPDAAPILNRQTHTVARGENLTAIAELYHTTWRDIAQLNGLANASLIYPGQVLSLPLAAVVPVVSTPDDKLKVGDKVRVNVGARTYEGLTLADFVYRSIYTVQEISKNRVVIGIDGRVTAAVDIKDLAKAY